jgi:hypothetical protein
VHAAADLSNAAYLLLCFPCCRLQVWATYSPVKNSPADARAKAAEGNPTHSAATGEMDIYKASVVWCLLYGL